MNRLLHSFVLLVACVGLDGCKHPAPAPPMLGDTYRPVYASYADVRTIEVLAPQPRKHIGKIYLKDNYLYINEVGTGIHIIDNRDPENPVPVSFVSIPGNQELAIKDSTLYADNMVDLVAINIANPRTARVIKRIENAFDYSAYPVATNIRFECADRDRGVVVRWEKAVVADPQCYR